MISTSSTRSTRSTLHIGDNTYQELLFEKKITAAAAAAVDQCMCAAISCGSFALHTAVTAVLCMHEYCCALLIVMMAHPEGPRLKAAVQLRFFKIYVSDLNFQIYMQKLAVQQTNEYPDLFRSNPW